MLWKETLLTFWKSLKPLDLTVWCTTVRFQLPRQWMAGKLQGHRVPQQMYVTRILPIQGSLFPSEVISPFWCTAFPLGLSAYVCFCVRMDSGFMYYLIFWVMCAYSAAGINWQIEWFGEQADSPTSTLHTGGGEAETSRTLFHLLHLSNQSTFVRASVANVISVWL